MNPVHMLTKLGQVSCTEEIGFKYESVHMHSNTYYVAYLCLDHIAHLTQRIRIPCSLMQCPHSALALELLLELG